MGYRIKKVPYAKGPGWKVQYEDRTGGHRRARDIPTDKWREHGFVPSMSIEEARLQVKSLNAQEKLKREAEARLVIHARQTEESLVQSAYLSPLDMAEFEKKYLLQGIPEEKRSRHKKNSYWAAARKVICHLKLDIEEWHDLKLTFYADFAERQWSPSYVRKIMEVLNLWGKFQARKYRKMFLEIPRPRKQDASRISDAYFDKCEDGRASKPLTHQALEKGRASLKQAQYNWLYLTVWLGLRPEEADHVKNEARCRIEGGVVKVYQSKLTTIARSKRWKSIEIKEPEQKRCLEIIQSEVIERPLNKTIKAHCAPGVTGYGGRKGFPDLMLDRGHRLEDISIWMGHHTIDRTWRSYKDRQRLRVPKAA